MELLPHVSRLLPMADKYFSSKAASEKANEVALAAMAEGVRGDLGQVTKAHAGLYRQLQDISSQIAIVSEDATRGRVAAEKQEERISSLEAQVKAIGLWVKAGVSLCVVLLTVVLVLVMRGR